MTRYDVRFTGRWRTPLPPDALYTTLADIANYASWWPEMRHTRLTREGEAEVTLRALLPYQLTMRVQRLVEDPVSRVLEAALDGDITGHIRWDIRASTPAGSIAVLTQAVTVNKPSLRRLMPLARPLFRLNHALSMRSGRRALLTRTCSAGG
ncbi:SRPBCC family protein [Streptomyces sp. NBC_00212]|uniref:SRPBCC family protein n=1 Tax=Streptomyces sp. NBC_00212 TaxID=2975684 RepID=UPI00325577B2